MPSQIPDGWIQYKACGKVIEGTRIICFKVPLKKSVQTGNSEIREIWDINALLTTVPNLGAVIDLTNTARYYNPNELRAAGVLHKKIYMQGRIIPPEKIVREFMNTVDEFLGKNCDFLIGVHCTHGLNRTGYMVCRYMRDRLGVPAKDAIKKFEIARGYQIERENFVADLLHKKPSLPFGGNTSNKSGYRNSMNYRSPLSEYEYDESSSSNYQTNRYDESGSSRYRTNRSNRNTSGSYDYRYDY